MKFKSDIEVQAGLKDSSGSAGTSGQILSSTASGVSWINQISLSGYVPYTGATTNVNLGTHTLLANDLVINHSSGSGVAASITKGGSGEALTINKTSGSGNAMSVTGGLTSLVDLTLSSIANATIDTDRFIVSDSGLIKYRTGAQVLSDIGGQAALTNPITGTGTTNYVSKFTGTTTLGNSQIFDNGTNVLIGTTTDGGYKLDVNGGIRTILGYIRGANSNADINLDGSVGSRIRYGGQSVNLDSTNVSFRTNALERMRITSTGNVGIGTTVPATNLEVYANTATLRISDSKNASAIGEKSSSLEFWSIDGSVASGVSGARVRASINTVFDTTTGSLNSLVFNVNDGTKDALPERMRITSAGNVGIGTTSPSALLTVSGDALINSITVGRGGGDISSNTVVGRNSFTSNSSGTENTVVGANAGIICIGNANVIIGTRAGSYINGGSGNTIIGTNNSLPPTTNPANFSDTLSISKGDSSLNTYLPHIWAPEKTGTDGTVNVISANKDNYAAMFVEYVIQDTSGNIRGGYIKGIWNSDLSVIKMTEDTTSSIGVTSNYIFDIVDDGSSNAALQLTSTIGDNVYCSVTSRLLTRPY